MGREKRRKLIYSTLLKTATVLSGAGLASRQWGAVIGLMACAVANAQVSVSAGGAPSYSHPISVPPGISGMQPNLNLTFAGGGVNGPVGYGWSLQGVSMITRCPSTRVVDGSTRGVAFAASDHLCLDGQRLIQTDAAGALKAFPQTDDALGLSGTAFREYRTENDTFARIRAYGASGANAANGPEYLRVWTKAGQIYDYGAPPAPVDNTLARAKILAQGKTVVMVWAVARISDVVGNYIDFRYEQRDIAWGSGTTVGTALTGREWNLAEVRYTGNGVQLPANRVVFNYIDRSGDRAEAYQRGSKNVSVRLLNSIDTYVNITGTATKVRAIQLGYQPGPVTGRNRLVAITDCTGAATPICQPPVRFSYADGASDAFTPLTAFNLSTSALHQKERTASVVTIDFDGDGRTDLLYYDQNPALNRLYRSNGDGSFTVVPVGSGAGQFNITSDVLFSPSGCLSSLLVDFDGDGLTDILRTAGTSCGGNANVKLFRNQGDGSFEVRSIVGVSLAGQTGFPDSTNEGGSTIPGSDGWVSYLIDVDGDGRMDVIRALEPASGVCPNGICTWVYKGDGLGNFPVSLPTSLSGQRLYRGDDVNAPLSQQRYVVDLDGDGLQDLVLGKVSGAYGGTWRSLGDGNFEAYTEPTDALDCRNRIDFNGDGRGECLYTSATATSNRLTLSTGAALATATSFNLNTSTSDALSPGAGGSIIFDANGDGRSDILRWLDDPTRNLLFLSNGDGSFTKSTSFNLTTADTRLKSSDQTITFVMGDFTGRGGLEILRLKKQVAGQVGVANENRLFERGDLNPPDTLLSMVSPSGLKTTINYDSLTSLASNPANSPVAAKRYYSDRSAGTPSAYPLVDLTLPMRVVVSVDAETGVGNSTVTTQYAYRGLKAALDGRGMLGFGQVAQQTTAPDGISQITIWTDHLLERPYGGVAKRTETRLGPWINPNAQLLSSTSNIYCDKTSTTPPTAATVTIDKPCETASKVTRPYVYKTVEQGTDLTGNPLPTVTTVNTYENNYGDPSRIEVITTGVLAGQDREYKKITTNTFCEPDTAGCPNKISGDNWILGRLTRSAVAATAPNLLTALSTSAGGAANASATQGSLPGGPSLPVNPAVLSVIMQLLLED